MRKDSLIFIANHKDLIGAAILRRLKKRGYYNLLLENFDLTNQKRTKHFFKKRRPDYVFLPWIEAAGIMTNISRPADLIYHNLSTQLNIIHSAYEYRTKKLLYLGSACSYPKSSLSPIKESSFLKGKIEKTNEAYAVAKICGVKMCEAYAKQYKVNFISAIPTNTYGPGDDFSESGHVIPSLIRKFHQAKKNGLKKVEIWGTGKPKREFLYVDDIADACIFLMNNKYNSYKLINIAGGEEISIKQLASLVKKITGFKGDVIYDKKKPDGTPRRLLDSSKIFDLGWHPKISLAKGISLTYHWYLKQYE